MFLVAPGGRAPPSMGSTQEAGLSADDTGRGPRGGGFNPFARGPSWPVRTGWLVWLHTWSQCAHAAVGWGHFTEESTSENLPLLLNFGWIKIFNWKVINVQAVRIGLTLPSSVGGHYYHIFLPQWTSLKEGIRNNNRLHFVMTMSLVFLW